MVRLYLLGPLLGAALLLGGANGGCGSFGSSAPAVLDDVSGVRWIGADPRPLAVGSEASLSFEVGARTACCQGGYRLASSAPAIVSVQDLGQQTLSVRALDAGAAVIELYGEGDGGAVGGLSLVAAEPAAVTFADQSHQAAAIENETALPPSFSLLRTGSETLLAVITDAAGDELASQGLTTGEGQGAVAAHKVEPEQFILTALPTTASEGSGVFVGGLTAEPSTALSYQIAIVDQPQRLALAQRTTPEGDTVVLAKALAADGSEVFGVSGWGYALTGSGSYVELAAAALRVSFPPGTAPQSATLTVTAPGGLSTQLLLP